jgi:ABC-type phosphate/phosphonate transport system substrate-binding protein
MGSDRVASLPMYDFPELRDANDAFWAALSARLEAAGMINVPSGLTRNLPHGDVWRHPSLLFAQGCEYPLATSFADHVRLVATPMYSAAGCEGARYRSAIVVRGWGDRGSADAALVRGAGAVGGAGVRVGRGAGAVGGAGVTVARGAGAVGGALADFRGRRCVINELDSNSGMNLLRAAVAPLAVGGRFFESVAVSGSHLHSVKMVASGEADISAIDCVSFAHFQRLYPSVVGELRILGWTPAGPSLPFITARSASDATVRTLRSALADMFDDDGLASVREQLLLSGVELHPTEGFDEVLALERRAAEVGYPSIC